MIVGLGTDIVSVDRIAVVLEKNKAGDAIIKDYKVMIKKVKKNPLNDGLN